MDAAKIIVYQDCIVQHWQWLIRVCFHQTAHYIVGEPHTKNYWQSYVVSEKNDDVIPKTRCYLQDF